MNSDSKNPKRDHVNGAGSTYGEADAENKAQTNFIRAIIDDDLKNQVDDGRVHTRFPPEPNGCLHIGHAKSICLNFGLALHYGGKCNLRFDDTNPIKEEAEFARAMEEDIRWLGFQWHGQALYTSDYFEQLYLYAVRLIEDGKAYVDDLTADEIREHRGTLTEPGKNSPYRDRTVEENLDLFQRMRAGEFPDGSRVLRARIDMASGNVNLRDPVMYRVLHATHHRTGDQWCIYPMYDWAHGQSDSIEGITHSVCDLSFEDHRPLYNWFLDQLDIHHPRQIEFARLNIAYTVLSKRYLKQLVDKGHVSGWDDPRMPTISGFRRRGYTPESIRAFCDRVGVAKRESIVDLALLEYYIREELNKTAPRVMAVLRPLKVVLENYPENETEELDALNNPEDPNGGSRKIPFTREFFIERHDFMEDPPRKFFRLSPGSEVRLKHAYFITCREVVKDKQTGEVTELRCTYDPASRGGASPDGRKVKGTLHWVSAPNAVEAEVRLYDRPFLTENPLEGGDMFASLNPDSLEVLTLCKLEPSLATAQPFGRFQFLRHGYFCVDSKDSTGGKLVFNRTVGLRDSWAKIQQKQP